MNYIINERGERVSAVGAEGSPIRIKSQYPDTLKRCMEVWPFNPYCDEMFDLAIYDAAGFYFCYPQLY